jgi:hypothetical protein
VQGIKALHPCLGALPSIWYSGALPLYLIAETFVRKAEMFSEERENYMDEVAEGVQDCAVNLAKQPEIAVTILESQFKVHSAFSNDDSPIWIAGIDLTVHQDTLGYRITICGVCHAMQENGLHLSAKVALTATLTEGEDSISFSRLNTVPITEGDIAALMEQQTALLLIEILLGNAK